MTEYLNLPLSFPPTSSAIVLPGFATGLATIRGLAAGNVDVIAAVFSNDDPIKYSRCCNVHRFYNNIDNENEFITELLAFSASRESKPVIFPSSDQQALFLAKNYQKLSASFYLSTTHLEHLQAVISRDELYKHTSDKVKVVSSITSPSAIDLEKWCNVHPAPYFLKPFYEGIKNCKMLTKNLLLTTKEKLISHEQEYGLNSVIVQQFIQGGDGYIFDIYGLCNKKNNLIIQASHRRLRQFKPNTGTTTFGDIPAKSDLIDEKQLFEATSQLLQSVDYHGIFGIEWLLDKKSGEFYLIDFNARPFSSIGHLTSCGLNLPLLSYYDLLGHDLSFIPNFPKLKQKYWLNFTRDLDCFIAKRKSEELSFIAWLFSIVKCRSFAYWQLTDPVPALFQFYILFKRFIKKLWPRQ